MSVHLMNSTQVSRMQSKINKETNNIKSSNKPFSSEDSHLASSTNEDSSIKKRSVDDFQFMECIGEGSYSKVYRAVSKKNTKTFAVKVLNKQHIHKEKKRKYVTIEKNTLNLLGKHPGIVTLYYTFQDPKSLYFVIDFAENGELLTLIHNLGSLSLELTRYYTIQLIDTVVYIHSKGIIHRDLKPENILLNSNWNLMITDFGAAKFINDENTDSNTDSTNSTDNAGSSGSFVGTAEYISPELLRFNQSSCGSDFWALGCIIYQMIVGKPPFKAKNEYQTFERIVDLDYSFPDSREYFIPSYVISLIKDLLVEDPTNRLGSEKIATYSWFKNVDWSNRNLIWGKVPLLKPYNPVEVALSHKVQPGLSTQPSQNPILKHNQIPATGLKNVQKPVDVEKTALKKQIINAQSNTQLMNKVNNRINASKIGNKPALNITAGKPNSFNQLHGLNVDTKRAVNKTPVNSPKLGYAPKLAVSSSPVVTTMASKAPLKPVVASAHVNKNQISTANNVNDINTNPFGLSNNSKAKRNSQVSLSSLLTNGESSKSVIFKSSADPGSPKPQPTPATLKTSNIGQNASNSSATLISNGPKLAPIKVIKRTSTQPVNTSSPKTSSHIPTQHRVPSSEAAAAAGAIGKLLTHNRNINSVNSTATQHKQLIQNRQKQMINPVLLDKKVPAAITSKLMYQETILKLDNIYKSEISHKANQFTQKGETLDHSVLESIIQKHERDLEKDLKSCIMVITNFARLFIYELNDNFHLNKPQSAIQMQAQEFYQKAMEIKLTNKNVSLYDYEFDEDGLDGYLILELANINKLIFLSAWDRSRMIKGGINSNVRVGFNINSSESWVNAFLNARKILRRRELAAQAIKNLSKTEAAGSAQTSSTSGNQQSFRSKLGTRLRSVSGSGSNIKEMGGFKLVEPDSDTKESKSKNGHDSNDGSHNNSIIDSVKELALGMRNGFKKESDERRIKQNGHTSPTKPNNDSIESGIKSKAPVSSSRIIRKSSSCDMRKSSNMQPTSIPEVSRATTAAAIAFAKKV